MALICFPLTLLALARQGFVADVSYGKGIRREYLNFVICRTHGRLQSGDYRCFMLAIRSTTEVSLVDEYWPAQKLNLWRARLCRVQPPALRGHGASAVLPHKVIYVMERRNTMTKCLVQF